MAFEYLVTSPGDEGLNLKTFEEYLNELGQVEWELVVYQPPNDLIIFKRRIAINAKLRNWQLGRREESKDGSREITENVPGEGL